MSTFSENIVKGGRCSYRRTEETIGRDIPSDARRAQRLIPAFNYKFRELLTHAAFRYAFACPIYCLMPDHI